MSTGLECDIINIKGLGWFYILQAWDCPAGAWDWREHDPDAGGPFPSDDATFAGLRRKHANPGGYGVGELHILQLLADPVLKEIIEGVIKREIETPAPPATGEEIAADVVSLNGVYKVDVGWFSQKVNEDGTVEIGMRGNHSEEIRTVIPVSVKWFPDQVEVKLGNDAGVEPRIISFISEHITKQITRILPGCPVKVGAKLPPKEVK